MTVFDIVSTIAGRLNSSSLKTTINGDVYENSRPINSKKEDVVVNCLPVNNAQLQSAVVNVNIHVPNKVKAVNGFQDNTQPDLTRLKELTDIALAALQDQWGPDYNYNVQQHILFEDEESKSHYINIRIDFNSINVST